MICLFAGGGKLAAGSSFCQEGSRADGRKSGFPLASGENPSQLQFEESRDPPFGFCLTPVTGLWRLCHVS